MKKPKKPVGKKRGTKRKPAKPVVRPKKAARSPAKPKPKPKPKPRKPARKAVVRQADAPVRFSDEAILKAAARPPFPNNEGDYADPGIIVPGGREPAGLARELSCPGLVVIYASAAQWVNACDGSFPSIAVARARAFKAAAKVTCPETCTRRVNEIWHGWDCSPEGTRFYDIAAVEVAVICQVEL